jgi:hypothetical protein
LAQLSSDCRFRGRDKYSPPAAKADPIDDLYWIRGAKSIAFPASQETPQVFSEHAKEFDLWHNRLELSLKTKYRA